MQHKEKVRKKEEKLRSWSLLRSDLKARSKGHAKVKLKKRRKYKKPKKGEKMKKGVVAGLLVIFLLGILSASSQAAIKFKAGYFSPADPYESEDPEGTKIPESGLVYGAEFSTNFLGKLGLGLEANYFTWEKSSIKGQIIPALVTLYIFPSKSFYFGAGGGYYLIRVDVGEKAIASNIGYHGVVGLNMIGGHVFLEARYSTCDIKPEDWKDEATGGPADGPEVNIGGVTLILGFSL